MSNKVKRSGNAGAKMRKIDKWLRKIDRWVIATWEKWNYIPVIIDYKWMKRPKEVRDNNPFFGYLFERKINIWAQKYFIKILIYK